MQKMSESKLQIHIIILLAQCALVCKYPTKSKNMLQNKNRF